jgi:hypothetical protein
VRLRSSVCNRLCVTDLALSEPERFNAIWRTNEPGRSLSGGGRVTRVV